MYGGGITDVYLVQDEEGDLKPGGGYPALFYAGENEGSEQYTDLHSITNQDITFVVTSTGSDGRAAGQIAPFIGPDGPASMWCSVNGSPRFLMQASNFQPWALDWINQLIQHLTGGINPHQSTLRSMADVDAEQMAGATPGQAVVMGPNGLWIAGAAVSGGGGGGGTGDATLAGEQTFTGAKTFDALATFNKGAVTRPAAANAVAAIVQALTNQTGNLHEWRDAANAVRAWVGADFGIYAPNTGRTIPYAKAGPVAVGSAGGFPWYNDTGIALPIRSVRGSVVTAGTSTTTFDVQVDGASIYGTAGNRPSIASGQKTSGRNTGYSTNKIPAGSYLTASILAAGTGAADALLQVDTW
jgi:hypothetical protein